MSEPRGMGILPMFSGGDRRPVVHVTFPGASPRAGTDNAIRCTAKMAVPRGCPRAVVSRRIIAAWSSLRITAAYERNDGHIPGVRNRKDAPPGRRFCSSFEKGDSIHLDELSLSLQYKEKRQSDEGKIVTGADYKRFQTNLDLPPGQMVVVGKTNFEVGNSALIAVISAKVVD